MSQGSQSFAPYPGSSNYPPNYGSEHSTGSPGYPPQEPPKKGCGCGCWLAAFAMLLLVAALLCAGVLWYVTANINTLGADFARSVIKQIVDDSELPVEDRQAIMQQVDRVVDGFKRGDITLQDFEKVANELQNSPLLTTLMVLAAEEKYIKNSGLSDEEKTAASLEVRRVAQGVIDKKISQEELEEVLALITIDEGNEQKKLKDFLTDEELRGFIAKCKELSDKAEVEQDPPPVDIAAELRKLIDRALGDKLGDASGATLPPVIEMEEPLEKMMPPPLPPDSESAPVEPDVGGIAPETKLEP